MLLSLIEASIVKYHLTEDDKDYITALFIIIRSRAEGKISSLLEYKLIRRLKNE